MKFSFLVLFFVLSIRAAIGQSLQPGEWRTYTSMRSVTAVALSSEPGTSDSVYAWAATSGGVFRINLRDTSENILVLHSTEGLTENGLTALGSDAAGNVYIGSRTGGFDVYRPQSGTVQRLGADIQRFNFPSKSVNDIYVHGSKIYLSTGFGVSVYLSNIGVFGSTATQISGVRGDSVQQVIVAGGIIYAAMQSGLASIPEPADITNAKNWTFAADTSAVRALAAFHGTIFAGTTTGLQTLSSDRLSFTLVPNLQNINITRCLVAGDSLYVLDITGNLYSSADGINFSSENLSSSAGSTVTSLVQAPYFGLIVGSAFNGLAYLHNGFRNNVYPPGPIANDIPSIVFAGSTDQLYVANGSLGFGCFQPTTSTWKSYEPRFGKIPSASYVHVLYDSIRDVAWFTFNEIYRVSGIGTDNITWKVFDHTHDGIPTFDQGTYIRTERGCIDQQGRCVITDWAASGQGIVVTEDGEHFTPYPLALPRPRPWCQPTQDMEGNYWVGSLGLNQTDPAPDGIYWHRWKDHAFGNITSPPLLSTGVNAVLTDQDDGIWCGTQAGLQIISNPYAINDPDPHFSIRTVPLLNSQIVSCLATDGVGNKWVGTLNGIFVVSADGADSVAHFSKENSPLIDNTVNAIAIDYKRGEAYIATPSGISRFSTIFKQGQPDYNNIRVYPNPVVQTTESSPTIYIDGLVAGSTVQIFSLNMKLITTINGAALGSTVTWDGRDAKGHQVPSGLYIVSASSPQSGENGAAKVVIIRKH